jgi:hypothetical protein
MDRFSSATIILRMLSMNDEAQAKEVSRGKFIPPFEGMAISVNSSRTITGSRDDTNLYRATSDDASAGF